MLDIPVVVKSDGRLHELYYLKTSVDQDDKIFDRLRLASCLELHLCGRVNKLYKLKRGILARFEFWARTRYRDLTEYRLDLVSFHRLHGRRLVSRGAQFGSF